MHRSIITAIALLCAIPTASSGNEAFVPQLSGSNRTGNIQPSAQNAVVVTRFALGSAAAKIAAPLKIDAATASSPASSAPRSNLSLIMQSGANNFVNSVQTGGSNVSTIAQNGTNNHAVLSQRH